MDTKDAIAKLVKIADSQQKIIKKLAQSMGYEPDSGIATNTADVTQAVATYLQQAVQAVAAKGHYMVQSANLGSDGLLHVSLQQPRGYDAGEYFNLKNKIKEMLLGKNLTSSDGKSLPVQSVNIMGMSS